MKSCSENKPADISAKGAFSLILGSASPRRAELLRELGFDFVIDSRTSFIEDVPPLLSPEKVPQFMSEGKSLGFHRQLEEGEVLLTADTVVILEGKVLGKPRTADEAFSMLKELSGKWHHVVSAFTIRDSKSMESFSDTAAVLFNDISDADIHHYIDKYSPLDKAGAYGIQEWIGLSHISRIEGSFYTIMGLPAHLVYEALSRY